MMWSRLRAEAPSPRALRWIVMGALALSAAVYAGLLAAGFVWDDLPLVVHNDYTGELSRVLEYFQVDLWRTSRSANVESGYYRPLVLLSFALDRALWGLSPAGHHAQSLAWHLSACAALLYWLRRELPPAGAALGLIVFALHPVQSEAVAWIAARNDLMVACFTFLSLGLLAEESPAPGRLLGAGLVALAAALSKESGVLLPGLLLALDLGRWGRPRGPARYGALLGAVGVWAALRYGAGIQRASAPDAGQLWFLVEQSPRWIAHYLRLLIWPDPLSVGASLEYLRAPLWLSVLGVLGALAGAAALVWRGGRRALGGLLFAALAFAPSLGAIALRGQLGERYLYLPMGGIALALGAALPLTWARLVALAPLGIAWLLTLQARLPEWASDLSLQSAALRDHPSPYTRVALAHILHGEGRLPEAAALFQAALEDERPDADACSYAILLPLKMGDLELAARGVSLGRGGACAPDSELVGLRLMVAARRGEWEEVARILGVARQEQLPLTRRAAIAGGALARRQGDEALFAEMFAAQDADLAVFEAQVARLLSE
ncbi:MAG: hypothetical protein H6741_09575 [Alphaproteobacteria bacterium]|nr:hypothetical protein [Alphaproteobacteria bacterium]